MILAETWTSPTGVGTICAVVTVVGALVVAMFRYWFVPWLRSELQELRGPLKTVEHRSRMLEPNGGSSLADTSNRTERAVQHLGTEVEKLNVRVDELAARLEADHRTAAEARDTAVRAEAVADALHAQTRQDVTEIRARVEAVAAGAAEQQLRVHRQLSELAGRLPADPAA